MTRPSRRAFVATLEQDVDPEGYAGCCEAIAAMDLRPALPAITAPTLVIAGREDPATPPWHGAVIARGHPGLPGCGSSAAPRTWPTCPSPAR